MSVLRTAHPLKKNHLDPGGDTVVIRKNNRYVSAVVMDAVSPRLNLRVPFLNQYLDQYAINGYPPSTRYDRIPNDVIVSHIRNRKKLHGQRIDLTSVSSLIDPRSLFLGDSEAQNELGKPENRICLPRIIGGSVTLDIRHQTLVVQKLGDGSICFRKIAANGLGLWVDIMPYHNLEFDLETLRRANKKARDSRPAQPLSEVMRSKEMQDHLDHSYLQKQDDVPVLTGIGDDRVCRLIPELRLPLLPGTSQIMIMTDGARQGLNKDLRIDDLRESVFENPKYIVFEPISEFVSKMVSGQRLTYSENPYFFCEKPHDDVAFALLTVTC